MKLTELKNIPANINSGVSPAKQLTMKTLLGNPRSNYSDNCQPVTNPALQRLIVVENVGPFKVTGLKPAVDDLREIFAEVKATNPELYNALGTAGMLCVRNVRGSTSSISNHSWGTAIDLTINRVLDTRGDNKVLEGLIQLAPYFNKRGWFWGAGFRTEDAMHFEVGDERIRQFSENGFAVTPSTPDSNSLSYGDRGPEVRRLQEQLNAHGGSVVIDGDFGKATENAVIEFQTANGLEANGVVNEKTAIALGLR